MSKQWIHKVIIEPDNNLLLIKLFIGNKDAFMEDWNITRYGLCVEDRSLLKYRSMYLLKVRDILNKFELIPLLGIGDYIHEMRASVLKSLFDNYRWDEERIFDIVSHRDLLIFIKWVYGEERL